MPTKPQPLVRRLASMISTISAALTISPLSGMSAISSVSVAYLAAM